MRVPGLLIGASLVFWGWQTANLLAGVLFGLVVELSRWVPRRWDLSSRDFNRITDLSTLGLILTLFYLVSEDRSLMGLRTLLLWMPAFFLPLLLAQCYSLVQRVPLTSLFVSLRRLQKLPSGAPYGDADLRAPFIAVSLISASFGAAHPSGFLPGIMAVIAWALSTNRSRRFSLLLWACLLVLSGALAISGNLSIEGARHEMQRLFLQWYREHRRSFNDPYRSRTAIGDLSDLKVSDRILFRVKTDDGTPPPLLQDATYNGYSLGIWFAEDSKLAPISPAPEDPTRWPLAPTGLPPSGPGIEISAELNRKGEALLIHPADTVRLERLPVLEVWRNSLGAIKAKDGPPLIDFHLSRRPGADLEAPPDPRDAEIPLNLRPVLKRFALQLGLQGQPAMEILRRTRRFFASGFVYSLTLERPPPNARPLEDFLTRTRAGHCEYFATATVLLLREAGISARYVTGYSPQEYSALEDAYVVRLRHAHAWARAYVNGHWMDLDTTPSVWADREAAEQESLLRPLSDLWSWIRHGFLKWRWRPQEEEETGVPYYAWLLLPLGALLSWRLLRGKLARSSPRVDVLPRGPVPGEDSEFIGVLDYIERKGWRRPAGQPVRPWLDALAANPRFPWGGDALRELAALHNRYRYRPGGISAEQRRRLRRGCEDWLSRQPRV